MKIPAGATHYNVSDGNFYKKVWYGMGFNVFTQGKWTIVSTLINEENLWPLDSMTLAALTFDESDPFLQKNPQILFDWKQRRIDLGLDKPFSDYRKDTVHTALLTAQALVSRVLEGEECFNAAVTAYDRLEEALEAME